MYSLKRCISQYQTAVSVRITRSRAAMAAALLLAVAPAVVVAQKKSERDSLNAQIAVLGRVRYVEYQLSILEGMAGESFAPGTRPTGICEIPVADWCYGPKNGGLAFGGLGTRLHSRRFVRTQYEGVYLTRFNGILNRYVDTLKVKLKDFPNDRFMTGELVRVNIDRGDNIRAFDNLVNCRGDAWWCDALRAYVMHSAGVWARADTVWEKALAAMPEMEKCAWLDPSPVIDSPEFRRKYQSSSCSEQIAIANRVWWLSDPLWSRDRNERRSAHLARIVDLLLREGYQRRTLMTPAMLQRANPPLPADRSMLAALDPKVQLSRAPWRPTFSWGYDELVMRVGVPQYTVPTDEGGLTVAQYPFPRASFVPPIAVVNNHLSADGDDWNLEQRYAYEFMTGWAEPVRGVPHQIAYFRRGDSARVIAAVDVRADTILSKHTLRPNIVLQRDWNTPAYHAVGRGSGVFHFDQMAARDTSVVSIELIAGNGTFGRVRFAAGVQASPEQRITMSDVLLTAPRAGDRAPLDSAAPAALGHTSLGEGATVGLFWEIYGLQQGEKPRIRVVATRERDTGFGGFLRGVFGGVSTDSTEVEWEDAAAEGLPVEARSVNVPLLALSPGNYTILVMVDVPGQQRVISRRKFRLVDSQR